ALRARLSALIVIIILFFFFFSSRRRHTRFSRDWSSDVCSSDLPRSGHEKGNVENKVGYIRYNFFTSAPIMDSYEGLTDQLFHKLEADRNRIHYAKNVRIEDLWQEERDYLLALPEKPYPVFKEALY